MVPQAPLQEQTLRSPGANFALLRWFSRAREQSLLRFGAFTGLLRWFGGPTPVFWWVYSGGLTGPTPVVSGPAFGCLRGRYSQDDLRPAPCCVRHLLSCAAARVPALQPFGLQGGGVAGGIQNHVHHTLHMSVDRARRREGESCG